MLYIFDMGNVIIDIDFKRVLGVWSNFSGTPLATLTERFSMGEAFQKHERGEISDEDFAALRAHGFTLDDIWDIGAIAAFYGMSNRIANMSALRPNDEFYAMGRG